MREAEREEGKMGGKKEGERGRKERGRVNSATIQNTYPHTSDSEHAHTCIVA